MPNFFQTDRQRGQDYEPLYELSRRIAKLLEPEVSAPSEWAACLDDLLGAVYSLFFAIRHNLSERPNPLSERDIDAVLVRAKNIAQAKVRTEGKWTAGFYLNNALFRIAAVYHRALKIYAGDSQLEMKKLVKKAEEKYRNAQGRPWESRMLKKVNCEVNRVKHRESGIIKGRDAGLKEAIQATDELLTLIEAAN
jgi:hypothetical protein